MANKKVTMNIVEGVSIPWEKLDVWQRNARQYTCTLKFDGKQLTTPYFMGTGLSYEPRWTDVLGSLIMDHYSYINSRDYTDFCNEFGYEPSEKRSKQIYRACERTSEKVQRLLGDDFERIAEALNEAGYC